MNDMTASGTSPARRSELPDDWIERLFRKMEDRYGAMWADRYGAFPRQRVKETWAEDLADLTNSELARGFAASKNLKFPPTLPEFRELCRPPINPEASFAEAVKQLRLRKEGLDTWRHPAIFWAAQSIGEHDMNQPWQVIKTRWVAALSEMLAEPTLPKIEPYVQQAKLPSPGQTSIAPDEAKKRIGEISGKIVEKSDNRSWARKILASPSGYPDISRRYAEEALGSALP